MTPARLSYSKFDGAPHWEFDGTILGEDEHGTWLAMPLGTPNIRPGRRVLNPADAVVLIPNGEPWIATFYEVSTAARPLSFDIYVDMTTVAQRDGHTWRAVDLDLDVVRRLDGSVAVLDEDEFAENQRRYAYPADVIALAECASNEMLAAITARAEPFGQCARARFPLDPAPPDTLD